MAAHESGSEVPGPDGPDRVRVALVLGTATGGMGRHVASLAQGLVRAGGFDVTIYGPATTAALHGLTALGARFVPLEIPANPRPGDVRAVGALRKELRAHPADIVHAHGLRAGLVAALGRSGPCRLVVTWHNTVLGTGARARVLRAAEKYVARHTDVTLGASDDLVARAVELGARDARLCSVAAPDLPAPTRRPEEIRTDIGAADRPLIVSVGRLHPQKGYDVLIAAAARWRTLTPTPLVAIAGTGPSYRDLAALVSTSRAPVLLLGHRADIADLLSAADLAVVTSVWEARQLFAQEALASGVPLVSTDVGGLAGLVGDAAVLVPAGDVDALDGAVRRLLADPALRAGYTAAGQARAATWPTPADTVAQVAAVYRDLAGPHP